MGSSMLCYDLLDLMAYHKLQIDHFVPIVEFRDLGKNLTPVTRISNIL